MPSEEEIAFSVEQTVKKLRGCGTPTTRKDWLTVIGMLIPRDDETLEEFLRQARMYGIDWLVKVVSILLNETAAGNTYRDNEGVLRLRKESKELKSIFE